MRDEFDARIWADHHQDFTAGVARLWADLRAVFERRVAHHYDAPWAAYRERECR